MRVRLNSMEGLLVLLPSLVLALVFVVSMLTVGRWIVVGLRLEISDLPLASLAVGITVYTCMGMALGAASLFRWPLLAVLAVAPAIAAVPRLTKATGNLWSTLRTRSQAGMSFDPLAAALGLLAVIYVLAATLPSFHYDVLVNYLGVPKDYLIQGHLGRLDHNIHSSLSMPLHVFISYFLALGRLVPGSVFLFGWAPAWGAFHLIVIVSIGVLIRRFAAVLAPHPHQAAIATMTALLLWLAMPQTLLLGVLENAEFLTTFLGLCVALLAVSANRRDDILIVGLFCGLLVAAKPQMAPFALTALVLTPTTGSQWKRIAAIALAATLPAAAQFRNLIVFGGFFFPYAGGSGQTAEAARALLTENAAVLPASPADLANRCWRTISLQPETGISTLALLAILLGPIRRVRFWILTVVATVIPIVLSSNTPNSLRWSQTGLVLLFLAAGVGLSRVSRSLRSLQWATATYGLAALWLATGFTLATLGPVGFLLSGSESILETMVPDYTVRRDLMQQPGQVLWMGELYGYYGAFKGPIAAPQNGFSHQPLLGAGSADEIHDRLTAAGYLWICFNRRHRATGPESAHWKWLDPDRRQTVADLLSALPSRQPIGGVTVYDLRRSPRSSP